MIQQNPFDTGQVITKIKQQHDITQRKCMSIVWYVLLARLYLKSQRFTIQFDHDPLKQIFVLASPTRRLALWCIYLADLTLTLSAVVEPSANLPTGYRDSTSSKEERLLEDELLLQAFDDIAPTNFSDRTANGFEHRITSEENTKTTAVIPKHDTSTLFNNFRPQKYDVFHQDTTTQVGHASSSFSIDSNIMLLQRSTVERVVQIKISSLHSCQRTRPLVMVDAYFDAGNAHAADRVIDDAQGEQQ